ncbi:MAG: hypothetical protein ACRDXX_02545, partial [Stackebrandtia sp.]
MNATRTRRALLLEARLQWRHRVVALIAALAAAWSGLLLALPTAAAEKAAPWLLVLETALTGITLAGVLVLFDRGQGVLAALTTSPLRLGEYLTGKVGMLTILVLASATPIALAGHVDVARLPLVLASVGLVAVLAMLIAVATAARCRSVIGFMIALPLILLPLLVPPVLHAAGFGNPLLYAAPTTGAMDAARAGFGGSARLSAVWLGWLALA